MTSVLPEGVNVMFAPAASVHHDGAPVDPLKLANIVSLAVVDSVYDTFGVLVGFVTPDVKSGDKLPTVKLVSVPSPGVPAELKKYPRTSSIEVIDDVPVTTLANGICVAVNTEVLTAGAQLAVVSR
jgi:hypothetical protein